MKPDINVALLNAAQEIINRFSPLIEDEYEKSRLGSWGALILISALKLNDASSSLKKENHDIIEWLKEHSTISMKEFDKFKILETNNFKPKIKSSLKPFVLLFDEMYTEIFRFSEAEEWMNSAKKMIFIGTSFSVNITSIALRIGMANNIPIEIVDPKPMELNNPNAKYFEMTGEEYCKLRENLSNFPR